MGFVDLHSILRNLFGLEFKERLLFSDNNIKIISTKINLNAKYSELKNIIIQYNSKEYNAGYDFGKYSYIAFSLNNKPYKFYYESSRINILRILKFLYHQKIKFKEYYNERRVYLGETPNYKEIQKIKNKYGIEW